MQRSEDGTVKNAVRLHDGLWWNVLILNTGQQLVSSQVGCSFGLCTSKLKE
jgi:23S rRNA (adenine2503-C2)-methyltransferase